MTYRLWSSGFSTTIYWVYHSKKLALLSGSNMHVFLDIITGTLYVIIFTTMNKDKDERLPYIN